MGKKNRSGVSIVRHNAQLSVAINPDLKRALQEEARRRMLHPSELVRQWLSEKLLGAQQEAKPGGAD